MIVVFNFGGQYAHLIARRVRQFGVKSELVSPETSAAQLLKFSPQAIIFSGSPASVYEKDAPLPDPQIYKLGLPILGICYGQQLMAAQLGGEVSAHQSKQFGRELLKITKSALFGNLKSLQTVWFSHGDQVDRLSTGFKIIASSKNAKIAGMEDSSRRFYGIQFHPEVTHTPNGEAILSNFLFKIAKAKKDWNLTAIKENLIEDLKNKIKSEKVMMALSGGVDSLVAATILKEAIGNNLFLVFINTGLLRKYDLDDFKNVVQTVGFRKVKIANAQDRFFKILKGVVDPEAKRQKIAKLYFAILEEEAQKIGLSLAASDAVKFLAQGTIYPDRVESAATSKHADKIKSHHNVTLPHGLKIKIVEPLSDLYKDEVRKIGKLLKIPQNFLNRHPFPGPGLAIRILGEVTSERLTTIKESDEIFISELKNHHIYNKVAQALAVLLPVKAVGVMGDARTYSYIVSLRSVDTEDFMTADWSKIPYDVLEKVSSRIVNEVRGVNRVAYDITQKPPATIEYE